MQRYLTLLYWPWYYKFKNKSVVGSTWNLNASTIEGLIFLGT
jgi:hypothetical protein